MASLSETHGMNLVQALQRICEIHADSDVEIRDAVKAFEITLCHTIEDLAKEDSATQYRTVSALRHQIYDLPAKLRIRAKPLCADKEKEKDSDQETDIEIESRGDRRDQGLIRRLIDGMMSEGIGIDPQDVAVAVAFERMAEVVTRMGEVVSARNARAFSEEYVTERMATLLYDAEWAAIECRTTVHNAHRRAVIRRRCVSLFVCAIACATAIGGGFAASHARVRVAAPLFVLSATLFAVVGIRHSHRGVSCVPFALFAVRMNRWMNASSQMHQTSDLTESLIGGRYADTSPV